MKGKILRCLAGACFCVLVLIFVVFEMTDKSIWSYLYGIGFFLLATGLLIDQPILSVVGCGVQIIRWSFILITSLREFVNILYYYGLLPFSPFAYYSLPPFALSLFSLIAIILLMLSALSQKSGKKFGILSGVFFAITEVIYFVFHHIVWPSFPIRFYPHPFLISELLTAVFLVAGAILTGFSMKKRASRAARHVPSGGALAVSDRIDQLTKLKNLLDQGILTQEEFEEKKEKILQ